MTVINLEKFLERDAELVRLCRGKSVLHLGCVGFTDCPSEEKVALAKQSLHAVLTDVASACTGIDLDGKAICELRNHGVFLNVIEGDVERLGDLPPQLANFDIVIAGDIIEHLSNPGLMLEGVKSRMKPDGRLVISTPNSFGIASWIRVLTGRFREGAQHVLCFNPITLSQLLERHSYEVETAVSCYQSRACGNFGLFFNFFRWLLKRSPKFGGTLLYVCKLKTNG
jgi:2-polyprenyl-3-methyl-5-hydroxy-6-metoxy-1,4-benzoquinol methylase